MFILDTNVVSELRMAKAGKANLNVTAWARSTVPGALFISAITVLELELGVLQVARRDPAQGGLLRSWLEGQVLPAFAQRVLPVATDVARRCAALHVRDPHSERDALIAAAALVLGMTVATRNLDDFVGTGVTALNPW